MNNDIWSALSDSTRREILSLLRKKEMSAGDIAQKFKLSKATVSHHLSVLKDAGLVKCRKEGTSLIYSLKSETFRSVLRFIQSMIK